MYLDLFSGVSTAGLQQPSKPLKLGDLMEFYLHPGENAEQYQSFLSVMGDLALAFKFLQPQDAEMDELAKTVSDLSKQKAENGSLDAADELRLKQAAAALLAIYGIRSGFQNFDASITAGEWNVFGGSNIEFDSSVMDEINQYFASSWNNIRSAGGDRSYSEIASGNLDGMSDEECFYLMCQMTESKERVFSRLSEIFGDLSELTDNEAVITHISDFLADYTEVDPHNIGILGMFFDTQSSFLNAIDAYMNCQTYWGGDGTSNLFMAKVDNYIDGISDAGQKDAALGIKSHWLNDMSRWDMVGDAFVGDLKGPKGPKNVAEYDADGRAIYTNTTGSWVEFFWDRLQEFNDKDQLGILVANCMNRSAESKYKNEMRVFEEKKDDLILDEAASKRAQAKRAAEAKRNMARIAGRNRASRAIKSSRKGKIGGFKVSSRVAAAKSHAAPKVQPKHRVSQAVASVSALKQKQVVNAVRPSQVPSHVQAARTPNANATPKPQAHASKKNDRKVI